MRSDLFGEVFESADVMECDLYSESTSAPPKVIDQFVVGHVALDQVFSRYNFTSFVVFGFGKEEKVALVEQEVFLAQQVCYGFKFSLGLDVDMGLFFPFKVYRGSIFELIQSIEWIKFDTYNTCPNAQQKG